MTLLCTKYYQNWSMSVEDIASQSSVIFEHDKKNIFGVRDSQGSAETLVRRSGITNYHLIAYYFSNNCAKNYHNRLMCVKVIMCNVSVVFLDTVYM